MIVNLAQSAPLRIDPFSTPHSLLIRQEHNLFNRCFVFVRGKSPIMVKALGVDSGAAFGFRMGRSVTVENLFGMDYCSSWNKGRIHLEMYRYCLKGYFSGSGVMIATPASYKTIFIVV
jgi:hypothetical protein